MQMDLTTLVCQQAGVDTVGSITGAKQSLKMLKLIRMAKLFRLFRLNRLFLYVKRLIVFAEETLQFRISDGFTKLLRLSVGTLVLARKLNGSCDSTLASSSLFLTFRFTPQSIRLDWMF